MAFSPLPCVTDIAFRCTHEKNVDDGSTYKYNSSTASILLVLQSANTNENAPSSGDICVFGSFLENRIHFAKEIATKLSTCSLHIAIPDIRLLFLDADAYPAFP